MRNWIALAILFVTAAGCSQTPNVRNATPAATTTDAPAIQWEGWSPDVFARAKREHRYILLDLEAVWCHWCHVMEETTYRDPSVRALIRDHYIAVRVDQDARPDLSNRYEYYGWPATVAFAADGSEIVKRQGYMPPGEMRAMLQAIVDDPTPGPSIKAEAAVQPAESATLGVETRAKLIAQLKEAYDARTGGWGTVHKFVDADVIEFCLASGDPALRDAARQTLTAGLQLIDPAWGGVYQYSTDGDWAHPHFEKIMSYQADDLRIYARASTTFHDPAYARAAEQIHQFLKSFLTSPEGAFYTSQDADLVQGEHSAEYFARADADRRKLGIPRVDRHIYARENGWAIEGLATLHAMNGDAATLSEAIHAADWILRNRSIEGGGFHHDGTDAAGPYLGDTLAMGRACLALYSVTADRAWLTRSAAAADFIEKQFHRDTGYATAAAIDSHIAPGPEVDENVALARFANLLHAYTGRPEHRAVAEHAMKYAASPQVLDRRHWMVGGILLADRELAGEPIHLCIVGAKDDPAARALFQAAATWPTGYKRVEWYDRREGPLPHMDVEYPELPKPAAFFCTGKACSLPVFTVEKLLAKREPKK